MNYSHCSEGGTGITNFSPSQYRTYLEAIRRSGYAGNLYVRRSPMTGPSMAGDYSLHYTDVETRSGLGGDLSPFWRVYEQVLAEHNAEATIRNEQREYARQDAELAAALLELLLPRYYLVTVQVVFVQVVTVTQVFGGLLITVDTFEFVSVSVREI